MAGGEMDTVGDDETDMAESQLDAGESRARMSLASRHDYNFGTSTHK